MGHHEERELARLRGLLDTARAKALASGKAASTEEVIGQLLIIAKQFPDLWQMARSIRPTLWQRIRRRRQLHHVQQTLASAQRVTDWTGLSDEKKQLLGQALCLIRFGSAANLTWYFHLSEIVDEHKISEAGLRHALSTDAVLCDDEGRLHLTGHGWYQVLLWCFATAALVAAGVLANVSALAEPLPVGGMLLLGIADATLGPVLWGLWQIGPARWRAARTLRRTGLWASS